MTHTIVDAASVTAEPGPHPAASPYDKRLTDLLGLTAFEAYQVELPPGGETLEHDHLADGVEDLYVLVSGSGWLAVDGEQVAVTAGQFIAVPQPSRRYLRAGAEGLVLVAVCGKAAPGLTSPASGMSA